MNAVYPLQLFPIEIWCCIGFSDYDAYDRLKRTCACFWKFCKANKHLIQKAFAKVTVKENRIIWTINNRKSRLNELVPIIRPDFIQWRINRKNNKVFSIWTIGIVEISMILLDECLVVYSIGKNGGVWYVSYSLGFVHLISHGNDNSYNMIRRLMGKTYYRISIYVRDSICWYGPSLEEQVDKEIRKEKPEAIGTQGWLGYLPNSYRKNLPTYLWSNGKFK